MWTALQLLGIGLVIAGTSMVYVPAGVIVLGLVLGAIGVIGER